MSKIDDITDNYNEIINIFKDIPDSGLFDNIDTPEKLNISINKFKLYCSFILIITKKEYIYILLQKKYIILNQIYKMKEYIELKEQLNNIDYKIRMSSLKKLIDVLKDYDNKSYTLSLYNIIMEKSKLNDIQSKINEENIRLSNISLKLGKDFEESWTNNILQIVSNKLDIPVDKLELIENSLLKKGNYLVGEIDVIVLKKDSHIVAIGEVKKSLDDISDAFYQINRSYDTIVNNDNIIIQANSTDLNKNIFDYIKTLSKKSFLKNSFIFSEFDKNKKYFKLPSKIRYLLLNILWSGNIRNINDKFYKKLFFKMKKTQKNRYITDIFYTFRKFNQESLLDRIQIKYI